MPSLQVPQWSDVWALGDCASVPDAFNPGKFCPPTAQHAIRQAAVLAQNIAAAVRSQAASTFPVQDARHACRDRAACGRG